MRSKEKRSRGVYRPIIILLKMLYLVLFFAIGLVFLMKFVESDKADIALRDFPFPYRAGLAVCSDIDNTDSVEEFLAIQRYLCTKENTPWGKGLGLEIGNSFWFYDMTGKSKFTVFNPDGSLNREAAPVIKEFIEAGYIDVLHSYGEFEEHEFNRDYAEHGLDYFHDKGLSIPIWVNHSEPANPLSIGKNSYNLGDNPESINYHTDLLDDFGIRYIEVFQVTHIIGQDVAPDIIGWFKMVYQFFHSILSWTKSGGWDVLFNNNLMNRFELDDGREFLSFRRFINPDGKMPPSGVDVGYIPHQIEGDVLEKLVSRKGWMILYTHLGTNGSYSEWIPQKTRNALRNLANRQYSGQLFITTTSRLLDYNLAVNNLVWEWSMENDGYVIKIEKIEHPLNELFTTKYEYLRGLTFYTLIPENTQIYFNDNPIENLQINPPDFTGSPSITIPWEPLEFPHRSVPRSKHEKFTPIPPSVIEPQVENQEEDSASMDSLIDIELPEIQSDEPAPMNSDEPGDSLERDSETISDAPSDNAI